MWWRMLVGATLAAVACTAPNPAYEATGEAGTSSGVATVDPGTTVTVVGSTGDGATTRLPETEGGEPESTGSSGGSSTTGDEPLPQPDPLCRFELFAVNELGELHVIDVDQKDSELRLEDRQLRSWALATDPITGLLYVNQRYSPSTIVRVDPFTPAILPDPIEVMVEGEPLDTVARATFRGEGELWIGTDDSHRFVRLSPGDGNVVDDQVFDAFHWGGDMVFLEPSCAVVPTLSGMFFMPCLPAMPGPVLTQTVEDLPPGLQFTGIAMDEVDHLWLSTSDKNRLLVRIDYTQAQWRFEEQIPYDFTVNDLSPVIHPRGC